MRRIIAPFLIILFAATSLVSCLKDDDDKSTYYSDTALSMFQINNIIVTKTTKSSQGTDSTYKVQQSAALYDFVIDQEKREVYNIDSLPYGTDGTKILVYVSTLNNGVAGLNTLDFSVPRTIIVRSSDGRFTREYNVKVNIHKQKAEDFKWTMLGTSTELAAFKALRAFDIDGKMVVFGSDGTNTTAVQADISDGKAWTPVTFSFNGLLSADMYQQIVKKGDRLYMIHNGKLLSSADGASWDEEGTPAVKQLTEHRGTKRERRR